MDFPIGCATGWGTFGLYLALHSVQRGDRLPIPMVKPSRDDLGPLHERILAEVLASYQMLSGLLERARTTPLFFNLPVIRALGNRFVGIPKTASIQGSRNIGTIFFEDTLLDEPALSRAATFDRIIAGSTWNAELLRGAGLNNVEVCIQGIDPTIFHPALRSHWFGDRYVIFSGGKLEFRKGQDILVAAFREFVRMHPEALLMVAWHNYWPHTMEEVCLRGNVEGIPSTKQNGRLDIPGWLEHNGIPRSSVIDLGLIPRCLAGEIVREADVAVFPNRAEGGTNLVAMECMASSVPTILSANTGHLDLIENENCIVLRDQRPVEPTTQYLGTEGWGESSVVELVEALESGYQNRDEALRRAARGCASLQKRTWRRQIDLFFEATGDLG